MVVTILHCECLNVCITENNDDRNTTVLGIGKVQELEFKTGIFGLRESSATCEFQLPNLIGKRDLDGAEIYRCHLCNSDFFVVYNGQRLLTDLVRVQERHQNNYYSCLFHVNIPPLLPNQERQSTNHGGLDYSECHDKWFDIVEREKIRLHDELQKKLYDYIKEEQQIYDEKCKKIDQEFEKLKCVRSELLDSSEELVSDEIILRLARPRGSLMLTQPQQLSAVHPESYDEPQMKRRVSVPDSQFDTALNEQGMFPLDEDEISAFPNNEWMENRMSLVQSGEPPISLEDDVKNQEQKVVWKPMNMARSQALRITRPELGSTPRSGYRGSNDEKAKERLSSEVRGQWIPPHTYVEQLNKKIVPYSMPGRPASRD